MEAFSLLKYWRGGGGVGPAAAADANTRSPNASAAATIVTAVAQNVLETDDEDDDDGPFFDLEFTVPDEADDSDDGHENSNPDHSGKNFVNSGEENEAEDDDDESDGGEGEREFKFTLSPSSNDRSDPNLSLSPSEDLFFKGKLVQVEPSSFVLNPSEPNSKPQFPALLLKSATKFRVFMLGLKKSKSNASEKESTGSDSAAPKQSHSEQLESLEKQPEPQPEPEPEPQQRKLFTVKFKVEEVPIMSLFTRDNSSRGTSGKKSQKQSMEESPSEEKRFSKEVVHKYLKMVKPLYIRVSRRYGDKLRFSGQLNLSTGGKVGSPLGMEAPKPAAPTKPADEEKGQANLEADACETAGADNHVKNQKQGNLPTGLRVACKHLGKSRSASSAVAAAPPGLASSRRRDDSLLQQQDGIQGAILHCKRSFNASRECESSQLPRSVSDPLNEISPEMSRKSTEKAKTTTVVEVFSISG